MLNFTKQSFARCSVAFLIVLCTQVKIGKSQTKVDWWLTKNDKSQLLSLQKPLNFNKANATTQNTITIDTAQKFQVMDGFGFALTGGSAQHIIRMDATKRKQLIQELFGREKNDVGISYLRLSIGASDLNDHVFSYDDLPAGETDTSLSKFNLGPDEKDVIPVLKEILEVVPDIKILGSPWSAPTWMKSNNNVQGGRLKDEYYPVYAKYFVKYIEEMKKHGINIDAITVQNEPFNDGNTPSMQFLAKEELRFIKNFLGPAFESAGINTKIILYDHNCDAPEYPISILTDPEANKYVDGSGFHLYAGPITALSKVHEAFPDKNLYFTEMMAVSRNSDFNTANPVERIVIGATENWSKNVILWNLAADPNNDPHTDNGGCSMCQGAITIDGDFVTRNLAYYTIGHASKFVPPGSVRVKSSYNGKLAQVVFRTPQGKTVLIVANNTGENQSFKVEYNGRFFNADLDSKATATYVW
jgi:glucosylceramidase